MKASGWIMGIALGIVVSCKRDESVITPSRFDLGHARLVYADEHGGVVSMFGERDKNAPAALDHWAAAATESLALGPQPHRHL